jgi:hypothetical protein
MRWLRKLFAAGYAASALVMGSIGGGCGGDAGPSAAAANRVTPDDDASSKQEPLSQKGGRKSKTAAQISDQL